MRTILLWIDPFIIQKHVVDALIDANPDAIKSREETWGRLPLHLACIYTASAQVLKALIERYEESLRITDKAEGRLPVHFACLYGSPFEISLLVGAEQRALVFKDGAGKTPLDLAHESKNPHREAILKRLEDRTRLVTEAMMQRRRQRQKQPPPPQAATQQVTATATSSSESPGTSSSASSSKKSKKSSKHSRQQKLERSASSSAVLNHTSTEQASVDEEDVKDLKKFKTRVSSRSQDRKTAAAASSRSISDIMNSGSFGNNNNNNINRSSSSKKSKKSKKNKKESSQHSKPKSSPASLSVNPSDADDDESKQDTPKHDNKSRSLTEHLMNTPASSTASSNNGKQKRNHLSSFLEANAPPDNDSSDEEENHDDEDDDDDGAKSLGVQSLPARYYSGSRSVGGSKNYMFGGREAVEENEELGSVFGSVYGSVMLGSVLEEADYLMVEADGSSSVAGNGNGSIPEIVMVEERIKNCDIRRQALLQECHYLNDSVARKQQQAERSKEMIVLMQNKLVEIRYQIQKERQSLSLSETGIELQKETLNLHEMKIVAVDKEIDELLDEHSKIKQKKSRNNARTNGMRRSFMESQDSETQLSDKTVVSRSDMQEAQFTPSRGDKESNVIENDSSPRSNSTESEDVDLAIY